MSISVGERIRHLRIHRQMSQSELVEGICSVPYLSRIENGKTNPSNQFLKKVSLKLNVNFEMFNNQNNDNFQKEIKTILSKIEEENSSLSKNEEALLKMALIEFIPPQLLIRVFTSLLENSVRKKAMNEADTIYGSYFKLIDATNALELTDPKEQAIYYRLHSALGKYFYTKQDFNKSDYHYSISETLIPDKKSIDSAKLFYNISLVKQRIYEDTTAALYYCKKAYDIFQRENDLENLVNVLVSMGVQYHMLSKYDVSLEMLNEAESYLDRLQSTNKLALSTMITYNAGRVYQKMEEFDKAITYYTMSSNNTDNDVHKAYIFKGLIEIKLHKKEWLSVKNLLNEAFAIVEKHKLPHIEIELHAIKAMVYKKRGDYLNYEKCMKYAIKCAEIEKYPPLIKKMSKELAGYYHELRFYKKSSEYYLLALNNS
ncbi:helix-turn-helix transcriptional regulator [Halobacillus litoralis]|uniref:helix-turn-helix transcriptional regulator n=1 Tax=Halobacillus litoralis TaxID=45668 RepID=UPI00136DC1EB|nr:helix-turn-helix transcriptional regulator [Halobacillus litoralis]MYL39811.1 helix-turn-helix domain-containing protein [Halobacillus litoralis]